MIVHANAKLGLAGRLALVREIERGSTLRAAAACFGVSPATAHRWWMRWRQASEPERPPGPPMSYESGPLRDPCRGPYRRFSDLVGNHQHAVLPSGRPRPTSASSRLDVLPRDVVDAGDGWASVE
jgi:hypothetical protein